MNASLSPLVPALEFRAKVFAALRSAFDSEGFVETDTPCGISAPAAEEYIEAPRAGNVFLRTSPELEMKRLLCAGMERIYQLGPCFRAGENGRLHRSEFMMLEYYRAHWDYLELLAFTKRFLVSTARAVNGTAILSHRGKTVDLAADWDVISVREAFEKFAPMSADEAAEEESRFELLLTENVEPHLPAGRPCVLIDYPVRFGAFARAKSSDPTLAERWELYVCGVELANAYGELTDPAVQSERFRRFAETRRRNGLAEYPVPEAFLGDLACGMPECAGAALGADRLVMLLRGASSLSETAFPLDPPD